MFQVILKNQKEASCNRLMGADLLNKIQIVLLHQAALFIVLLRHFTAYCVQVAVDVGTPVSTLICNLTGLIFRYETKDR